jgi:hypothetical protein
MAQLNSLKEINLFYPRLLRKNRSAFFIGIARILDITSSLSSHKTRWLDDYNDIDFYAVLSDWEKIGDDIKSSMNAFYRQIELDARPK